MHDWYFIVITKCLLGGIFPSAAQEALKPLLIIVFLLTALVGLQQELDDVVLLRPCSAVDYQESQHAEGKISLLINALHIIHNCSYVFFMGLFICLRKLLLFPYI